MSLDNGLASGDNLEAFEGAGVNAYLAVSGAKKHTPKTSMN